MSRTQHPVVGDDGELLVEQPVPPSEHDSEPAPPRRPRWIELSVWRIGSLLCLVGVAAAFWVTRVPGYFPPVSISRLHDFSEVLVMQILDRPPLVIAGALPCTQEDFASPQTQMVMATEPVPGEQNLYLLPRDATQACLIPGFTEVETPRWSPDGQRILFSARSDAGRDLFVYPALSGMTERLTFDNEVKFSPEWSPDGTRIAYAVDNRITILDISKSDMPTSELRISGSVPRDIDWSPDGSQLVVRGVPASTHLINVNGWGRRKLENSANPRLEPTWLPHGDWIAWIATHYDDGSNIVLYSSSQDHDDILVYMPFTLSSLSWLPAGDSIAFLIDTKLGKSVVIQPLRGEAQIITSIIPGIVSFDWR